MSVRDINVAKGMIRGMQDIVRVGKNRKLVLILVTLFFSYFFLGSLDVKAEDSNENLVNIYFVYSNTCSHCHSEEKLLEEIERKYSNIKIYRYEIQEEETKEVLEQLEEVYSFQSNGVPITVIGNKIYTGYSEEKSKLKFIKTIEYFSRYGYRDELGEALKVEKLPEYQENQMTPTLEDFLDTYGNIRLFGEIYTDDLVVSLTAILLGLLSGMNGIFFAMTLLIVIILKGVESRKDKILLLGFYFIVFFSVFMTYVFQKKEIVIGVAGLWFLMFWVGVWKYGWNKRIKSQKERKQNQNKTLLLRSLFIMLAVGANYVGNYFSRKYVVMLKEILELHQLLGVERVIYYLNYFFTVIIFLVFFAILVWKILNKIYIHKAKSNHL